MFLPETKTILSAVFLSVFACVWASAHEGVLVERFYPGEQPPAWTIEPANTRTEQAGLLLPSAGEEAGIRFDTWGLSRAFAPWAAGTEPFDIRWKVQFERGYASNWRHRGFYVGVASQAPGKMSKKDIAIIFGVHKEGISASVRMGETFEPIRPEHEIRWPPPFGGYIDKQVVPRYALNQGGAGGRFYSMEWPDKNLSGEHFEMRIERTSENVLRYQLIDLRYKPGSIRWEGQWKMPADIAAIPLSHVVIQTVFDADHHANPSGRPTDGLSRTHYRMTGRIYDLQARRADAPQRPELSTLEQSQPVLRGGVGVRLTGSNLHQGAVVKVGGITVDAVEVQDADSAEFVLPDLPLGVRYPLEFINADGLGAFLDAGVPYGRLLETVEPREVLPAGGGIVRVTGGGFEKNSIIRFNDRPADIVEYVSPQAVRVRVPSNPQGRATVTAITNEYAFAGEPAFGYAGHPYLLFDAQELALLRKRFQSPKFADYRTVILAMADAPIDRTQSFDGPNASAHTYGPLFGWLMTGEQRYRDKIAELIGIIGNQTNHHEFQQMKSVSLAIVYDAMFSDLTDDEKMTITGYLDRSMAVYIDRVKSNDWWFANGYNPSNTIAVGSTGGGMAGLALCHSSDAAVEAARLAPETINSFYRAQSEDGGNVEGTLYWDYALTNQLKLGHALKNVTGDDHGLLSAEKLRLNYRFVETVLGGNGVMFSFNDSQPWLTGVAIAADFGNRFDQPLMRWLADHCAELMAEQIDPAKPDSSSESLETAQLLPRRITVSCRPQYFPFAFVWRGEKDMPADFPGVPTMAYLEKMNWGVMRSQGDVVKPNLIVGIKGHDGLLTHHGQEDKGGFELHARGEAFIIDPGYYNAEAANHSLPLINGNGPDRGSRYSAKIIDAWESGSIRDQTRR